MVDLSSVELTRGAIGFKKSLGSRVARTLNHLLLQFPAETELIKKGAQLRSHKLHSPRVLKYFSICIRPPRSSSKRFEMTRFDAFYKVS